MMTGLPPGEEQSLEIQGSVTVCSVEVETEIHEENAFNDGHFYCETCCKLYADECDVHGPPLFTHDSPTLESAYSWVSSQEASLIGQPQGRPPKNESPQQPIKNKVHEESAESEQSTTDLDGSAVPQSANTDGVMPQELPTSSHICGECLRTFSHLHLLKSHNCIQQADGPHGCSHCGLYFNRLCNPRRHERTIHGKERPYCCSLCLKSFMQASGLERHQESHSRHSTHRQSAALADATIYPCDHCPFSFTAERYLHKHVRRHHPEMTTKHLCFNEGDVTSKDHSCTQCSKIFRTIRGFKNHACFRQGDQLYLS
ncbi:hypothetical protein AOLI_G00232790 [Acnodon oligacanthus]